MKCKSSGCLYEQEKKFKFCPECGCKAGNEDITASEVAGVTKTDGDVPNAVSSQPSFNENLHHPEVTTCPVKKKATDNDNLQLAEVTTSSVEKHAEQDTLEATNNEVTFPPVEKLTEQDTKKAANNEVDSCSSKKETNNEADSCSSITRKETSSSRIPGNCHETDLCGTAKKGDKRKGTLKADVVTGTTPPNNLKTEVGQEVQESPNREFLEERKTDLDANVNVAIKYEDKQEISVNPSKEINIHTQASNSSENKNEKQTETIQDPLRHCDVNGNKAQSEIENEEKASNEHGSQCYGKSKNDFENEGSYSKVTSLNKGPDNDEVQEPDIDKQGKRKISKKNDKKKLENDDKYPKTDKSMSKDSNSKHVDNKQKGHASIRTEEKVKVFFHVLVSKSFHLDTKKHSVYIICEPLNLGGWNGLINKMTMKNYRYVCNCLSLILY
ncbi:hypothetical protein SNE40_018443 [Patella caerulea]|uniref:Uncharacterized protein n=1 Tax=Patella caerulea TaxID=87958 RepID=A0AAN8J702_PATCE